MKKHILIVEDDESLLTALEIALEVEKYGISTAKDGKEFSIHYSTTTSSHFN